MFIRQIMRFLFIGLALLILCVSCEEDRWYNVPDDAQEYIDAFSDYANQRGYQIDIKESGLIIEYNQLEEGVFASIFYEDPVRIEIDRTAWMSMSGYAKELLLYQYLAYGFLNRQTLNTKFPNGEWVSIMRGIPFDEYDSQVLNFQGFRKEYYINELFDSSIDSPWWADYSVTYDSLFQANNTQMLFEEDFLEDDGGWCFQDEFVVFEHENGHVVAENNSDKTQYLYPFFFETVPDNYLLECIIKIEGVTNAACGLVWAGDSNNNVYSYTVSVNGKTQIFNVHDQFYLFENYPDLTSDFVNYKKLSIYKLDELYYFFMDEKFLYVTDLYTTYGMRFGFSLEPGAKVFLDRMTLRSVTLP
jgi:hypothetical protein